MITEGYTLRNYLNFSSKLSVFYSREYVRFLLVGMLNTAFGYGIYAILVFSGFFYHYALPVATVLGVCFNYITHGKLSFGKFRKDSLPRYVLIYFLLYLINAMLLEFFVQQTHNPYLAQLMSLPIRVIIAYPLMRWVYRAANSHII